MYNRLVQLSDLLTPALLKTTQVYIDRLHQRGIHTVQDMLLTFPRAYEDLSDIMTLADAPLGEKVTLRGSLHQLKLVRTRSRKVLVQAQFIDTAGDAAKVVWFNQPHILRMVRDGQDVVLVGKVVEDGYALSIQSPSFERGDRETTLHAGRIVPVYSQEEGLTTMWMREKMALLEPAILSIHETLDPELLHDESLMSRADAIRALHHPRDPETLAKARERMAFEEMYHLQRDALERKKQYQGIARDDIALPMHPEVVRSFFASLQFTPTFDQKRTIYEILKDMEQPRSMSRLLEGDVGSGKTLVAVAVMIHTLVSGGQCALMAPTEVLARQHADSIAKLCILYNNFVQSLPLDHELFKSIDRSSFTLPSVAVLVGSLSHQEASDVRRRIAAGLVDIVIGTHALIQDSVHFHALRFVVIDEQHRFGVEQRRTLAEKGSPHVLSMTATPIPRTLALTAYGDHDLSVLLEKPGNRLPIVTKVVSPSERKTVERFIDTVIDQGRQVYVICPLIGESASDEMVDVKNVEAEAARLRTEFPRRRIALLHGKMPGDEKDAIMRAFKAQEFDILVSTSVIEVGIDVPNAVIICIEGAERFGLAQLHQFRGRVGRSDHQSYCYLFPTSQQQATSQRLHAMEQHTSGFDLAEIDLQLRGPGEIFGLRQSGIPELTFGSLTDVKMVLRARKAAERGMKG